MDCFIKKISEGNFDDKVHLQFQKFSKGIFSNRAIVDASCSKDKFRIATSPEYSNELVQLVAEKLKDGESVNVSGLVVSTRDLDSQLNYKKKSQFMGVKKYLIENKLSKQEILELCEKFPLAFIGLSFSVGETELKIKQKAPKSPKPSKEGDEKPKADFCVVKTTNKEIAKNIIFDFNNFKKISISHDFIIDDLKIPMDEKDPVKMREKTIRKGKVRRIVEIDGNKFEKEFHLEA